MREASSFRDPSGYVFRKDNILYRQVNLSYQMQFDHLMSSGLFDSLINDHLLISHEEAGISPQSKSAYLTIKPEEIPFVSYPYEWPFGAYKDAALATLKIQRKALDYGMILKDASAYNIQFVKGTPILIDTLSFDFYEEGTPWVAYGQFCRHFLAPLLLMTEIDIRLSQLMRIYIDGIPLDLASKLLKRKGGMTALQHIHWHANAVSKHSDDGKKGDVPKAAVIKMTSLIAMIEGLIRAVEKISLKQVQTEWGDYYAETNYSSAAGKSKEDIISYFLEQIKPDSLWDLGANDGRYSLLSTEKGTDVVAFDIDEIAVERNYQRNKKEKKSILPLVLDLTNPSPAIGFANLERSTIPERQHPDCIMALALIHHLAISNNLPFEMISEWLAGLSQNVIIEFVPIEVSKVMTLLRTRKDIFEHYSVAGFETAFSKDFVMLKKEEVLESERILYLLHSRRAG